MPVLRITHMYDGRVVRSMTNLEETQYGETMSCPRAWPTLIGWQPLVPDFDIPKFCDAFDQTLYLLRASA